MQEVGGSIPPGSSHIFLIKTISCCRYPKYFLGVRLKARRASDYVWIVYEILPAAGIEPAAPASHGHGFSPVLPIGRNLRLVGGRLGRGICGLQFGHKCPIL